MMSRMGSSRSHRTIAVSFIVVALLIVGVGLWWDDQRTASSAVTDNAATEVLNVSSIAKIVMPAEPRLLIMGDSYTEGFAAEAPRENGWAYLTAAALGFPSVIDGVGGTGWTTGTGVDGTEANRYSDRVARMATDGYNPNIVIVQGGQNDYRLSTQDTTDAVVSTIAQMREAWPGVQVIVIGPSAPQPLGETHTNANRAITAAAIQSQAAIINPIGRDWMTDENSPGFSHTDGSHLNTAGHRYLADQVLAYLPEIGLTASTPS